MKKHIEVLESRRDYLKNKVENIHVSQEVFLDVFKEELAALDWALETLAGKAEDEVKVNPYTGEIDGGKGNPRTARTFAPIGSTGHYGPIRVGATVQALCDVKYADIMKGEIGKLTKFDTWDTEEYPYIARFDGGRTAAFAREDIRRVD